MMKYVILSISLTVMVILPIRGDDKPPSQAAQPEAEKAIRAVDEEYIRDYNKGDSKALAALFTEDADVTEAEGDRYQGRDAIEKSFDETFAASKGATIALEIESIRFLTADVAKEEGRSVVTLPKGAPVSRPYTVVFVRRDGRWLIASVREDFDTNVRPHDRLKDLEWMLGDWVDEGTDAVIRVQCQWSPDENFLIRSHTVKRQGKAVMTVTQRIGWDPLARQFRSWEFDSEGGYGEGRWSRDGESWIIKTKGVRPEGTTASATNIIKRERADRLHWVSTDRVLGDESVPDEGGYILVRVPPPPRLGPKPPATPSPSTNAPRSPQ